MNNRNFTTDLQFAIDTAFYNEALQTKALEKLDNGSTDWKEIVTAANYLWNMYNTNNPFEKVIMEALETLVEQGFNIEKSRNDFLSISLILAKLHFKYGRFRHASNYLLILRDNDDSQFPSWIYNYSAKLAYKIDLENSIKSPNTIIDYLETSLLRSNGEFDQQALAVIREFLVDCYRFFQSLENGLSFLLLFTNFFTNFIQKYGLENLEEWQRIIVYKSEIKTPDTVPVDLQQLQQENHFLLNIIKEKQLQIQQLQDEIDNLIVKNKDLETEKSQIQNESNSLHGELVNQIREEIGVNSKNYNSIEKIRILLLGSSQINETQLWGIASTFGLRKDQLELNLDYAANKRFDLSLLRYNSAYDGILVGPIAHKVKGLGDHTSVIQKLITEDGFPPSIEIRTQSGELKITKSSFRESLKELLNVINTNNPT